jgi:hypothetical protein
VKSALDATQLTESQWKTAVAKEKEVMKPEAGAPAENNPTNPGQKGQQGGAVESSSGLLGYGLIGSIALVAVSGGTKFLKDLWQNGSKRSSQSSDEPPKPRGV